MAADNHTTIVGNLVEDPELRFTNTGIAVANMLWTNMCRAFPRGAGYAARDPA